MTLIVAALCRSGQFQSTPSLRKVTQLLCVLHQAQIFQSTPSLRKVTLWSVLPTHQQDISIHTFLAEGDICMWADAWLAIISIHTFLAEGDGDVIFNVKCDIKFQSTPSLRKVTWSEPQLSWGLCHFNPHLPCGRWHVEGKVNGDGSIISIHTFLAEGDGKESGQDTIPTRFQSTPSLRKVTSTSDHTHPYLWISIHTFLAEGDYTDRR